MPAGTAEAFCDGHNAAFAFLGGVPRSIPCDRTTIDVARICGDGKRERTKTLAGLQSHYLLTTGLADRERGMTRELLKV